MQSPPSRNTLLGWTTQIVSSYVQNNTVPVADLPSMIEGVYETLGAMSVDQSVEERPEPAVAIRRSVTPDFIVCLEDGKKLKMLKRHLRTAFDMSPDEYRRKWALPPDYPMVAPNYAVRRSALAKQAGLGRARRQTAATK